MGEPEPVGGTLGFLLLRLLGLNGWSVSILPAFAGDGVLVTATKPGYRDVAKQGASVADVAVDVVRGCTVQARVARRAA